MKSRNFRRRIDDEANGDNSPPPTSSAVARKAAASAPKPRTLLSFADDDDSPTPTTTSRPRPIPSKAAGPVHRVSTAKDRATTAPPPKPSVLRSEAGEYTKEKLLALQKNARPLGSLPRPPPPPEPERPRPDKPAEPVIILKGLHGLVRPSPVPAAKEEDEKVVEEEEEETEKFAGLDIRGKGKKDSHLILDQAAIDAIKKERLRQARAPPPEFISLDAAAVSSSDEEDENRKGVFEKPLQRKKQEAVEEVELQEEDEDDEERLWEEEQFRKGLGKKRLDEPPTAPLPPPAFPRLQPADSSVFFSQSVETMSMSEQAAMATRALRDSIGKLKEAHGRTVSLMERTDENLSEALTNVAALEKALAAADEKFVFMQQLRDFISVLCSFLQDKAPYIEELEDQLQKLNADRASAARARRAPDNEDNAHHSSDEVDEFGRDLSKQRRLEKERRAAARARRQARGDGGDDISSDESEGDAEAYTSCRDELLHTAGLVLEDASEEFAKVSAVKERLQAWKTLYGASYRDAYMGQSAAQVFAPYARLELLWWDPLRERKDFSGMDWHDQLFDFDDVVPELVEEVALPRLRNEIRECWDPMSLRMTEKAAFATEVVVSYLGGESDKAAGLVAEVKARLAETVEAAAEFKQRVRLLRNVCLWKEVLSAASLEELAVGALLVGKLLPELRRMGVEEAVVGAERLVAAMAGSGVGSERTRPLVECLVELGRRLEKRRAARAEDSAVVVALARRLKKVLVELNEYDRARALLKAFNLREAL